MNKEQINSLLNDFGKNLGIEDLSFDDNNYCCLFFDDFVINLELTNEGDILYFYANVGEIPSSGKENFYEMLLQANFLFSQTNGASLGISKQGNFVLLSYQIITSGLDLNKFTNIVENFVNTVELWSKKIDKFDLGDTPPLQDTSEITRGIKV